MNPPLLNDQKFIDQLRSIIKANLNNENFGVSYLASEMGTSRSSLYHKVFSITQKSVSQFIREIRITEARKLLEKQTGTVSEIAYAVGFGSPAYFIRCFHEYYGFAPGELNKTHVYSEKEPSKSYLSKTPWYLTVLIPVIAGVLLLTDPFSNQSSNSEKSIAVLPFEDESPEKTHSYIAEGLREEILNKLCMIEDIIVISKTSSDLCFNRGKNIHEMGQILNARYILEGSIQTINNISRIRLQLIETSTDKHLWSKPYERNIDLNNIFQVQKDIALSVANELNAVITPEEEKKLERIPTKNLTAYHYYLKGMDYINILKYQPLFSENDIKNKCKECFEKAIHLDSNFKEAYTWLGHIHINLFSTWAKNIEEAQAHLDSGLTYVNKALTIDENCQDAWVFKGQIHLKRGDIENALKCFDKLHTPTPMLNFESIKTNVNYSSNNYFEAIKNYLILCKRNDFIQPYLIQRACKSLAYTGFPEIAMDNAKRLLYFNDSIGYNILICQINYLSGNYEKVIELAEEALKTKPHDLYYLRTLIWSNLYQTNYENSYKAALKLEAAYRGKTGEVPPDLAIGLAYFKYGLKEKAELHLNGTWDFFQKALAKKTIYPQKTASYIGMALIEVTKNKPEEALKWLKQAKNENYKSLFILSTLKNYPDFKVIKNDPTFNNLISSIERNYQNEHFKTFRILKENGLIKDEETDNYNNKNIK